MSEPTEALALVTAAFRRVRYVLLIERTDGAGWAMPGGAIEPGESSLYTAWRELYEETGLHLWRDFPVADIGTDEPRRMPDPDGAVTVVARCDLGEVDALPEVRGGGDARRARWIMTDGLFLDGGTHDLFPAHREILGALR